MNSVKVGPFEIKVKVDQAAISKYEEAHGATVFGFFDPFEMKISLKPGLNEQLQKETLFHEILHACLFLSQIDLDEKTEEGVVSCISPNLWGLLKSNKNLRKFLFENAEEKK